MSAIIQRMLVHATFVTDMYTILCSGSTNELPGGRMPFNSGTGAVMRSIFTHASAPVRSRWIPGLPPPDGIVRGVRRQTRRPQELDHAAKQPPRFAAAAH